MVKYKKAIAILIIFIYSYIGINLFQNREVETISYWGSKGEEVIQIQTRLKNWGYYKGNIDGVYGTDTFNAVKKFQQKNGLKADGVAGTKTLKAIGLSSNNKPSNNNVTLLARAISGEARGEPYEGQVAVGAVILNRVENSSFPNSISGVVYQPGAFDSVRDGQINMSPSSTAMKAARDALNGWDPSGGAIYFFNPRTSTSKWIWTRTIIKTIGRHHFAK